MTDTSNDTDTLAFGPNSQVEALLSDYGLGVDSWASDVLESDTDRLLLALLLEERGENSIDSINQTQGSRSGEADYESYRAVTATADFDKLDWGYPAETVVIHNLSKPVVVAFKDPARDDAEIPVDVDDSPFVISGTSGLDAEQMWFKRPGPVDDHEIGVIAIGE